MRLYITLFFLLLSTSCKTGISTTHVNKEAISETDVSFSDSINVIEKILRSLDYDFDYSLIEWSAPDSTGKQYKVSETKIQGHSKASEEVTKETTQKPIITLQSQTNEKEEIKEAVKKSYPWYIKFFVILGILLFIIALYKAKRLFFM